MRNTCFKAMLLGLALAGWMAGSNPAHAQILTPIELINWNHSWKYVDTGANLGTAWRTNSYNDNIATWKGPGTALLGYEPDTPTVYNPYGGIITPMERYLPGSTSSQVITYYFRTTFTWPAGTYPTNYFLVASNTCDDGVYMYLNGMPMYGIRVAANAGYMTQATSTGTEGALEVVEDLPSTRIRYGANLVAVELHQSGTGSSDAVFGLSLVAVPYEKIAITTQPKGVSIVAGAALNLTVVANGSSPAYQWYQVNADGVTNALFRATNSTYTVASASDSDKGNYFVVVTNAVTRVVSSSVVVNIRTDPLRIVTQPLPNVYRNQGVSTNVSLEVTGSMPTGQSVFKWYKITPKTDVTGCVTNVVNNVTNISGCRTNITYTTNLIGGNNTNLYRFTLGPTTAGWYYCVVTNGLGAVTSSVCRVRVVADTYGPEMVSAMVENYSEDIVRITFDEAVLALNDPFNPAYQNSGWNLANYSLFYLDRRGYQYCTNEVPIAEVTSVASRYVFLRAATPWNRATNYLVVASGVADLRATNVMVPRSWIPIGFEETNEVIRLAELWRYAEPFAQDEVDTLLTTNWTKVNYNHNTSFWGEGYSPFWYDPTPVGLPCVNFDAGSLVTQGVTTHYFRKIFTWNPTVSGRDVLADLRYVLNDGAVFYLNGTQIAKVNMPATWNWRTAGSVGGQSCSAALNNIQIGPLLLNGNNVLAVETHQSGGSGDLDVCFAASLTISYLKSAALPNENILANTLRLFRDYDSTNGVMTLYWTNKMHNVTLATAEDAGDPVWVPLQPAATNMIVSPTNTSGFFRLLRFY